VYYWPTLAALPLAFVAARLALAFLLVGVGATVYAWCRKRATTLGQAMLLVLPALVSPVLRLAFVLWGYLRYPRSPE
jgi:hypothetical protein